MNYGEHNCSITLYLLLKEIDELKQPDILSIKRLLDRLFGIYKAMNDFVPIKPFLEKRVDRLSKILAETIAEHSAYGLTDLSTDQLRWAIHPYEFFNSTTMSLAVLLEKRLLTEIAVAA